MGFEREKFKRLVHYIAWKVGNRDWFGATKLNKVLWFSDIRAYALTGSPITGATYIREKHGPVPKAIMPIREELVRERSISVTRSDRLEKIVAYHPPNVKGFSDTELAIGNWWCENIASHHTAKSISAYSHDYTWHVAEMGETIPMVATFATCLTPPSKDDLAWARGVAAERGLP